MSDQKLEAEITLDASEFTTTLKKVSSNIGGLTNDFRAFSKAADDANKAVAKGMKEVGESVKAVSLATIKSEFQGLSKVAGSYFDQTISRAGDFEEGLRKVNVVARLSDEDLNSLGKRVKGLNAELGTTIPSSKAIAAELEVMRHGFTDAKEATYVLGQAMLLTGNDSSLLEGTVKALTGTLKAYGAGANEAGHFADVLTRASQIGAGDVGELSNALGKVGAIAASSGVPIEQVAAAIATLGKQGAAPTQSAVSITQIIESLEKKSPKASAALRELGVVTDAQNLKNKGLQATIEEIVRATDGRIDRESKLIEIFGKKNLKAAIGLADGGGVQDLQTVTQSSGAAIEQQRELSKSLNVETEKLKLQIGGLAGAIGAELAPGVKLFVSTAREFVSILNDVPKPLLAVGVGLAGLVSGIASAAAAVAGLGVLLPTMGRGFSSAHTYMSSYGAAAKTAAAATAVVTTEAEAAAVAVGAVGAAGSTASTGIAAFLSQVVLGPAIIAAFALSVATVWHEIANLGREQEKYINLSRGQQPDGSKTFKGPRSQNSLKDLLINFLGGDGKATTTDFNDQLLAQDAILEQARKSKADALASNERIGPNPAKFADPYTLAGQTLKNLKRRLTSGLSDGSIVSQEEQEERELTDPRSASRRNAQIIEDANKTIAEAEARKKTLRENRDKNRSSALAKGAATGQFEGLTEEQVLQLRDDKKEEFKDRRGDILNADDEDLSLKDKADALRKLFAEIKSVKANGEPIKVFDTKEIREVEKAIAQLDNRAKKQARNEGAARSKELFAEELDEIKTSGRPLTQKKEDLQALYTKTEKQRDAQPDTAFGRQQALAISKELRLVEDEYAKTQKRIDEDHRKQIVETAKIRLESQQAILKGLLVEQAELERLDRRGASNLEARQANLEKQGQTRGNEQRQKSNIEIQQAGKIDDPAERARAIASIKRKDAEAQKEIDEDISRKKTANSDAQKVEDISRLQEVLAAEERLKSFRVKDYQDQVAAGKDVSQKLIDAIKDREKTQEKAIQAQKESATVGLDSSTKFGADKIAAAERDATIQTLEARRAARKEIEAITSELEKQRGIETHLGEISADPGGLNVDSISKRIKQYRGGSNLSGVNPNETGGIEGLANPFGGLDTSGLERSLLNDKSTKGNPTGSNLRRPGDGPSSGGYGSSRASGNAVRVDAGLVITLLDSSGRSVPARIEQVTSSGKGSTTARLADRMDGFASLGGRT